MSDTKSFTIKANRWEEWTATVNIAALAATLESLNADKWTIIEVDNREEWPELYVRARRVVPDI